MYWVVLICVHVRKFHNVSMELETQRKIQTVEAKKNSFQTAGASRPCFPRHRGTKISGSPCFFGFNAGKHWKTTRKTKAWRKTSFDRMIRMYQHLFKHTSHFIIFIRLGLARTGKCFAFPMRKAWSSWWTMENEVGTRPPHATDLFSTACHAHFLFVFMLHCLLISWMIEAIDTVDTFEEDQIRCRKLKDFEPRYQSLKFRCFRSIRVILWVVGSG